MYPRELIRRGTTGWVVLAYDLDGSGRAQNIRLVDSEPKDAFVQSAASSIAAQQFKKGSLQTNCTYLVTYTTVLPP